MYGEKILIISVSLLCMICMHIIIWIYINKKANEKIKKCNKKEKKEKKGKHNLNNNDMDGIIARYFMLL